MKVGFHGRDGGMAYTRINSENLEKFKLRHKNVQIISEDILYTRLRNRYASLSTHCCTPYINDCTHLDVYKSVHMCMCTQEKEEIGV